MSKNEQVDKLVEVLENQNPEVLCAALDKLSRKIEVV